MFLVYGFIQSHSEKYDETVTKQDEKKCLLNNTLDGVSEVICYM